MPFYIEQQQERKSPPADKFNYIVFFLFSFFSLNKRRKELHQYQSRTKISGIVPEIGFDQNYEIWTTYQNQKAR